MFDLYKRLADYRGHVSVSASASSVLVSVHGDDADADRASLLAHEARELAAALLAAADEAERSEER